MAASVPKNFWSSPLRYLKWASYEKPAIFYSVALGTAGPLFLLAAPTLRRWAGDEVVAKVPMTYPVPKGPRKQLDGYDDPK